MEISPSGGISPFHDTLSWYLFLNSHPSSRCSHTCDICDIKFTCTCLLSWTAMSVPDILGKDSNLSLLLLQGCPKLGAKADTLSVNQNSNLVDFEMDLIGQLISISTFVRLSTFWSTFDFLSTLNFLVDTDHCSTFIRSTADQSISLDQWPLVKSIAYWSIFDRSSVTLSAASHRDHL